jgi:hypothetical protein
LNYLYYFGNREILKIALLEVSAHIKPDRFLTLLEYLRMVSGMDTLLISRLNPTGFNPVTVEYSCVFLDEICFKNSLSFNPSKE